VKASSTVTSVFKCPLERAFKTPILGDATQTLTGYVIIPPIAKFSDDTTWGQVGGHRIPYSSGNFLIKKGPLCDDEIVERKENEYWKWAVSNFKTWSLFFAIKAEGELFFETNSDDTIAVKWTYTFYSKNVLLQPFNWLFVKIFWNGLQSKAIKNMKHLAETEAPYCYED
jgi:hypothetical protein